MPMASRGDVSFFRDLLHKPVVDCDGQPVGALLDLATGRPGTPPETPVVLRLVIRPKRGRNVPIPVGAGGALVLPWDTVETLEPRTIRLRQARADLAPAPLGTDTILLRKHIMDQQVVDRRGLKLQRVNDIAMDLSEGSLRLWGMDTGVRGFLARLGHHWGLLGLLRPLYRRMPRRVIHWECVERLEPTRGHIRLRLSQDEVRSAVRRAPDPHP